MGASLSKSKHPFFKPIKDRQTKGVGHRDHPVIIKPKSTKPNNFFAQKETASVAKRNRRRNNKNSSFNLKKKKISKSLIGKPTNFQHTSHIGAGEVRSGEFDVSAYIVLNNAWIPIIDRDWPYRPSNLRRRCWILLLFSILLKRRTIRQCD